MISHTQLTHFTYKSSFSLLYTSQDLKLFPKCNYQSDFTQSNYDVFTLSNVHFRCFLHKLTFFTSKNIETSSSSPSSSFLKVELLLLMCHDEIIFKYKINYCAEVVCKGDSQNLMKYKALSYLLGGGTILSLIVAFLFSIMK